METTLEQPKQETTDTDIIETRFPIAHGWKNVNLFGRTWRCNKWKIEGCNGRIIESYFVTIKLDNQLVLQ
jgi:hypothetical protein